MKYKAGDKVRVKYKNTRYSIYKDGDIITLSKTYKERNIQIYDNEKWWTTVENSTGINVNDFELVVEETPKKSYTSGTGWGFE